MDSKLVGSLPMTWTKFSKTFLENYMPYSLHENLMDPFTSLEYGSIMVVEYEVRFYMFPSILL